MKDRSAPVCVGIVLYEGVEPIDLGGTAGVLSMAQRILPKLTYATIARNSGPLCLAGGLIVQAAYGLDDAPVCDVLIVCGGPGWPNAARDDRLLEFLRAQPARRLASVCTGAMILAAAGSLDDRAATTRRMRLGTETLAPLDLLASEAPKTEPIAALVVDDIIVTGGGVCLAIDTTLYLIGKLYGEEARDEVATIIEYDRSFAANREALNIITRNSPSPRQ